MTATRQHWGRADTDNESRTHVDDPARVDDILTVLNDSDSLDILAANSGTPTSARELADRCGVPLSTTYRKINEMVAAGLLDEQRQITQEGRHLTRFTVAVTDIQIHVSTEESVDISVSWRERGDAADDDFQGLTLAGLAD